MIIIKNLSKVYQTKYDKIHALRNINLELGNQGLVMITGKSGSGKSTLLNILGGLEVYDDGDIIINGKSTKNFTKNDWDAFRNQYVGYVYQEFYLIDDITIKENVSLALKLQNQPEKDIEVRVQDTLKLVSLEDYINHKPTEISGGQAQRVAIARALIKNPELILADEPTGNLDSETGRSILELLKELSKTRLVIMVTHDEEFAKSYGERIIELHDGVVVRDTTNNPEKNIIEVNDTVIIDISEEKTIPESVINYLNGRLVDAKEDLYLTIYRKDKLKNLIQLEQANYEVAHKPLEIINEPLALKKPKFHFNNWIKLAFHNLFTKKVKLALMLFLFTLSLTFVGVGLTLSLYDAQEAVYQTFQKGDITTIPFMKHIQECGDGLFSCY